VPIGHFPGNGFTGNGAQTFVEGNSAFGSFFERVDGLFDVPAEGGVSHTRDGILDHAMQKSNGQSGSLEEGIYRKTG